MNRKKIKAMLSVLTAAALILACFAGCGASDKDTDGDGSATTATTAATTAAPGTTGSTTAATTYASTTTPSGGDSTSNGGTDGSGSGSATEATTTAPETTAATTTEHVHEYGEWSMRIEPTCTEYGEKVHFCACGDEESLGVRPIDHSYVGTVCEFCGAEIAPSDGLDYHYDNEFGGYCVSIGNCRDKIIVVPSTYDGQPVVSVCYDAFKESEITGIILPDTVTYIGDNAFENCYSLTSIVIPEGVTYIGEEAFARCYELVSAVIPDSVTYIDDSAFNSCWELTDLTMGSGVTYIGRGAFAGCEKLPSVVLPDTLTEIADRAFYACGLTEITIPGSVELIGEECFDSCGSLASVTFKKQNTFLDISRWAFARCTSLTDIYVEGNISDWNNIGRWGNWNVESAACTVHCDDGDVEAY